MRHGRWAGAAACATVMLTLPACGGGTDDRTTVTSSIEALDVAPGEEDTVCRTIRLDNETPAFVRAIHTRINQGSHHMIVYRSNATSESSEPAPCNPFQDIVGGTVPLALAQKADVTHPLPEGTGFRIEPNQMIKLELHHINVSGEPLDVRGEVDFELVEAEGSDLQAVDFLFFGTTEFEIPPRSEASAQRYYPIPEPTARNPEPIHLVSMTSHTHELGTHATVERVESRDDPGEVIHESHDWAEPPIDRFDPPLVLEDGGLRVTCEWKNDGDETVRFGQSFYDEMCFGVGMYYPSRGFLLFI